MLTITLASVLGVSYLHRSYYWVRDHLNQHSVIFFWFFITSCPWCSFLHWGLNSSFSCFDEHSFPLENTTRWSSSIFFSDWCLKVFFGELTHVLVLTIWKRIYWLSLETLPLVDDWSIFFSRLVIEAGSELGFLLVNPNLASVFSFPGSLLCNESRLTLLKSAFFSGTAGVFCGFWED